MELIHTTAYALELIGTIVTCVLTFNTDVRTTSLVIFLLIATFPLSLILKLRVFFSPSTADADQKRALYYFISLAELCARTLPVLVLQIGVTSDAIALARYATAMPNVCMICARFLVWRRQRFLAVFDSGATLVFEASFSAYLAHRIFILLLLFTINLNGFIMLVVIHAIFGACHSLDELADEPFGEGRILTSVERKLFNTLTLFPIYPVMSVLMYVKILKPDRWWAIFYYVVVLSEHVCIILLYFHDLTEVSSILLALAFITFACHILYSNYYADELAETAQSLESAIPRAAKIYFME